ncbi:MAG: putative zinc-binding protein [Candidatus Omnitrophica bacterium]|nr:putative zinc-binding protein [Candidatus Omnitrophota bacterium]
MQNHTPSNQCQCSTAPKLIFPCSGASDVGEISDRAARRLTKEGKGKMYCLAGVGGRVSDILVNIPLARKILVIDGCAAECAKHTLLEAGFKTFEHLQLKSLGLEKGQSAPTFDHIQVAVSKAAQMLET